MPTLCKAEASIGVNEEAIAAAAAMTNDADPDAPDEEVPMKEPPQEGPDAMDREVAEEIAKARNTETRRTDDDGPPKYINDKDILETQFFSEAEEDNVQNRAEANFTGDVLYQEELRPYPPNPNPNPNPDPTRRICAHILPTQTLII